MNQHTNAIANRLSLRQPQRDSLEILARICEIIDLDKSADVAQQLEIIKSEFPTVEDFERDFPSLCFALATGVGKTRLMGAFIAYLHRAEKVQHFFVLAPNLTIYRKLIADFTPGTPKYVFQGIHEFATRPPQIITSDNYESGVGVRNDGVDARGQRLMFDDSPIHINIFNISKINSEVRGGNSPRIKRLNEYIGDSYFAYLAGLDDLVLLMDESHRYRASAGVNAINELKPILGLELTATPQVERGTKTEKFKNAIYSYPLASALTDGFIKQPSVATRENFNASSYDEDGLESLKLKDGIIVHEETKVQLEVYARENGVRRVKPFMLVVAKDTEHANALMATIESKDFFDGAYKGKVITVHSKTKGDEKDEVVEQLLTVEDPANPVEIVVHVNMLKEGWDVTNLYTIVPLRKADSRTLVEQSIGRGLRLPYGKRTGNAAVDRLTIVAHDKFQEIVDEANRGDSILVTGVVIGKDIPEKKSKVVEVVSKAVQVITGQTGTGSDTTKQKPLFTDKREVEVATTTLDIIKQEFERLPRSSDLNSPEVRKELVAKVKEKIKVPQAQFEGMEDKLEDKRVEEVITKTTETYVAMTIDIPRITLVPTGDKTCGYKDFDLDAGSINQQPMANNILIQTLRENKQTRLLSLASDTEKKLEDYLVRGLIDYNDISYDDDAKLLYKLSGQLIDKLRTYLTDEADIRNVLLAYNPQYVRLIHAQMQEHFVEEATDYEVHVSAGFNVLRMSAFNAPEDETPRPFRQPVDEKKNIRSMLFGDFDKCLFPVQKFDSDTERRFAVVLENDKTVSKWVKPNKGTFQIHYSGDANYEPDFVAQTDDGYYLCEPKDEREVNDEVVQTKARAAAEWCKHASTVAAEPWHYLLIPHTAVDETKSLASLAAQYTVHPQ
ncbi:DEAD/DEAH box helicase [Rhodopirellula bahusiensis]|uniref:Type III restriction endonuclease subunit R n=1 Tax=Rhodopirellula bahusiensis TaxID=2014065 RepID=A0A2G1W6W2_9BACT|nr:DEAD/DEAH box helicase family protein [Rhodopirellula bahusiensis]PHQ34783.1 type III restriction endonuclease subunit R [Rhodopirellula bahusiensis]